MPVLNLGKVKGADGGTWTSASAIPLVDAGNKFTLKNVEAALQQLANTTVVGGSGNMTSVKDYGATGNGTTDDTLAIETALAAALTKDKILYFPIGTYLIRRGIVMRSGLQIIGAKGATLIKKPAITQLVQQNIALGDTVVYVTNASLYEVGQDFYLYNESEDSPYSATYGVITAINTSTNMITFEAYKSTGAKKAYVTGATTVFSNTFSMITTNSTKYNADNILIEGITLNPQTQVSEPKGYPLAPIHIDYQSVDVAYLGGVQKNVTVRNNIVLNSPADGISVQAEKNVIIENNQVYNCAFKGIHVGTTITNVTIRNNVVESCGDCAIYWCYGLSKLVVTNNYIKNCNKGCHGIDGQDVDSIIAFNTFDNCTNSAINVGNGGTRCLIYGNVFTNMNVTANGNIIGIDFSGNVSILHNLFTGWNVSSVGRGIQLSAAYNINISDNQFVDFIGSNAIDSILRSGLTDNHNIKISGNIITGGTCINFAVGKNIIITDNQLTPKSGSAPVSITSSCSDIKFNNNIMTGTMVNNGVRISFNGITCENTGGIKPNETYYAVNDIVEDTSTKDLYVLANGGMHWLKLTSTIVSVLNYFYNAGVETMSMVAGYVLGTETVASKQSTYLQLDATTANTEVAYVTDDLVDLTNINTLYIDWENTGAASGYTVSTLVVSPTKAVAATTYTLRLRVTQNFARNIGTLDVSSLSGSYYVRVHSRDDGDPANSLLKVYSIGYK